MHALKRAKVRVIGALYRIFMVYDYTAGIAPIAREINPGAGTLTTQENTGTILTLLYG